jgi:hypothetical protein
MTIYGTELAYRLRVERMILGLGTAISLHMTGMYK